MTIVIGPPQPLPCSRIHDIEAAPTEVAKGLLAAREHDDLDILCLARQCVEHPFDTVVVRVHDRIVQNDRRGCAGPSPTL